MRLLTKGNRERTQEPTKVRHDLILQLTLRIERKLSKMLSCQNIFRFERKKFDRIFMSARMFDRTFKLTNYLREFSCLTKCLREFSCLTKCLTEFSCFLTGFLSWTICFIFMFDKMFERIFRPTRHPPDLTPYLW